MTAENAHLDYPTLRSCVGGLVMEIATPWIGNGGGLASGKGGLRLQLREGGRDDQAS
jgi:hypothetical protein